MQRRERLVLAIAVLASFVAFLDGSIINVALPAMGAELGGGLPVQQWIVDAYLITLGSLILVAGSFSDLLGRILILRIGLIAFGVTSLAIAIAPTAELVIGFRALQGIAGALLVPSSLALIIATFQGAAQGRAIGTWTAWTSASFLAGPFLGGLFVDFLSWRWVFAINVLPIATTLVLLAVLGERDERSGARIDWLGAALCAVGLGGPVFALIEQERFGWASPVILVPAVVGVASFVAFIAWQARARHPMLPLGLFAARNFSVGNVATALIYASLSLGGLTLVIFLQQGAGFPATIAALALLPVSIGNVLLSRWFGGLSGRFGPRLFMAVGPILAGIGYLLLLRAGTEVNYWLDVLPGVLLFAIGLSATVAPLTAAILGAVPPGQSGIGSAVNNAVARVAGLVAIAFLGVIAGGAIDVDGFHRVLLVTAALLIGGGIVSAIGIRNPQRDSAAP